MNQKLTTEKLDATHLEMVWLRRRFYAFSVTTFAVFMVLVLSWSVNVRGFRVDNNMRFRLADNQPATVERFNKTLINAMNDSTSDAYLIGRIGQLGASNLLDSPHLAKTDLDSIRNRIQIFTKFNDADNLAKVKVSFLGRGSRGEQALVNRICEDLLNELGPDSDFSQVDLALQDVSNHLKNHIQAQDRFSRSIKSMVDDVEVKLASIENRMANVWENNQAPVGETLADAKLKSHQNKLERLEAQKDELLLDFNADSELMVKIEEQIEVFKFEIEQIKANQSPSGFTKNTRFRNVSYFNELPDSEELNETDTQAVGTLASELEGVEVSGLVSSLDMVDSHRRDDLNAPIEFLGKLKGNLGQITQVAPAAALVEPGVVRVVPVGGKPGGSQMLFLTMLALAFGSVVAWQINPKDVDRGFENSESLESSLGIPVVSQFPLQSDTQKTKQAPVSVRLVRICEILALSIVAVVVLTCLFSPVVRAAMLENPMDGLARIVSLFRKN